MRHVLVLNTVTTVAFGVIEAASTAALVELARLAYRATAGRLCTAGCAVDLASVAVAANQHLHPTSRAQKETSQRFHWRSMSRQRTIDRAIPLVKYSPCTRARHAVGHDIGVNLVVLAGVVPVSLAAYFYRTRTRLSSLSACPSAWPCDWLPVRDRAAEGASPVALRAPSDAPSAAVQPRTRNPNSTAPKNIDKSSANFTTSPCLRGFGSPFTNVQ